MIIIIKDIFGKVDANVKPCLKNNTDNLVNQESYLKRCYFALKIFLNKSHSIGQLNKQELRGL